MIRRLKTKLTKWLLIALLATAAIVGLPFSALAVCSLSSTSISFGIYDVFSTSPLDTNGSIVYRCGSADNNISISLDRGGASSFSPRQMLNGSQALNYNLYLDAARTIIGGMALVELKPTSSRTRRTTKMLRYLSMVVSQPDKASVRVPTATRSQ